nr:MAG TPA: hypothetical protein [Caudoviricetes sp.]
MSTETMYLLISLAVLIIAMIYLDIIDERATKIEEIAEEQGWADPAKVRQLDKRPHSRAAHRRARPTPAPVAMDAQYFTMPDGEKVRRR